MFYFQFLNYREKIGGKFMNKEGNQDNYLIFLNSYFKNGFVYVKIG